MIDFEVPAETAALRDEIQAFVAEKIVPFEKDPRITRHGPDEELRTELLHYYDATKMAVSPGPVEIITEDFHLNAGFGEIFF